VYDYDATSWFALGGGGGYGKGTNACGGGGELVPIRTRVQTLLYSK
jgi:hypothetical protein